MLWINDFTNHTLFPFPYIKLLLHVKCYPVEFEPSFADQEEPQCNHYYLSRFEC